MSPASPRAQAMVHFHISFLGRADKVKAFGRPRNVCASSKSCFTPAKIHHISLANDQLPELYIGQAVSSAELRAAASLRAAAFSKNSVDRSEFAVQAYRRMKADAEWGILESKISGNEPGYQGIKVSCLVACLDDADEEPLVESVSRDMDLSCKIPAGKGRRLPQIVVGTLDINQGVNLPGEQLIGAEPKTARAELQRAYLSNICTHGAVRRRGVARRLIQAAVLESGKAGVRWLYVHAAASNTAAIQLYMQQCGFEPEQEEGEDVARRLNRPKRFLFRKHIEE